ncbi:hypothetical protein BDB00DRAFT_561022 [Zychaea mexicana]|uniref:uncharacterized protein n=1 Tax=Zychaea mexicana TaxID=64656 RepID=UPI0022FE2CD2|nr:uncharacterized protein BDB00DRAFT_561022 [Zychaea mexicana]KAI9490290.1 hypothetical protein BDB00DRAFT_561022 [Zychaea mexicana]
MASSSVSTALCTLLVLIPTVPLLTYVIGLLLPASHIVSRKRTFAGISQADLWHILVDVQNYPTWRPRVTGIDITENTTTNDTENNTEQQHGGDRIVFQENNTRNRTIVVIHVHQILHSRLLRILQEIPTFSGSWTFELDELSLASVDGEAVSLKITQQGVIKKPMLRVMHMLILGLHRRIDLFLNDLERKLKQDQQGSSAVEGRGQVTQSTITNIGANVAPSEVIEDTDKKQSSTSLLPEVKDKQPPMEKPSSLQQHDLDASINNINHNNGWDMISEIYERAPLSASSSTSSLKKQQ